jgi:hypothetical protein
MSGYGTNNVPVQTDAKNRSWRTLIQGLGIDVATALFLVLAAAVTNIEWTKQYWWTLLLLAGKSIIQAIVSYFVRLLVPPAGARQ